MSMDGFRLLPISTTISVLKVYEEKKQYVRFILHWLSKQHHICIYPVLSGQTVQLNLTAAHGIREVNIRIAFLLLPVHVCIRTSENRQNAAKASNKTSMFCLVLSLCSSLWWWAVEKHSQLALLITSRKQK